MKIQPYPVGTKVRVIDGERKGLEGTITVEKETPKHALVNIDGIIHKIQILSLENITI